MNRILSVVGCSLALFATLPSSAQISLVNPVPHEVKVTDAKCLPLPKAWKVVTTDALSDCAAANALKTNKVGVSVSSSASFTVTLGVKGDKCVAKVKNMIPDRHEGYYLRIDKKGAVIAAADETGLFWGVQTLLASMAEGKLQKAEVTDWPDVPYRGTVEGFYGTPWSHQARLSQIEFYGRHKMNVYIYGPKDDPYHRNQWREPYPQDEAARIQEQRARKETRREVLLGNPSGCRYQMDGGRQRPPHGEVGEDVCPRHSRFRCLL